MKTHLLSLRALQSSDDQALREELSLLAVRERVAVVRAFADEVERLTFGGRTCGPYKQLVEELARLGCRILETAATASRTVERRTPLTPGLWDRIAELVNMVPEQPPESWGCGSSRRPLGMCLDECMPTTREEFTTPTAVRVPVT